MPSDFLALMETSGPGVFSDRVLVCSADNPARAFDVLSRRRDDVELSRTSAEHYEDRWPPFPWWPEEVCLVQWASEEFLDFHWLTEGEPGRS